MLEEVLQWLEERTDGGNDALEEEEVMSYRVLLPHFHRRRLVMGSSDPDNHYQLMQLNKKFKKYYFLLCSYIHVDERPRHAHMYMYTRTNGIVNVNRNLTTANNYY